MPAGQFKIRHGKLEELQRLLCEHWDAKRHGVLYGLKRPNGLRCVKPFLKAQGLSRLHSAIVRATSSK